MKTKYSSISVIPMPKEVKGIEPFTYDISVIPKIYTNVDSWQSCLTAFLETAKRGFGVDFSLENGGITINKDVNLKRNEYLIKTFPEVTISVSEKEGLCYALATLLQLMKKTENGLFICNCEIFDYPDTEYRGVMACVAQPGHPLAFNDLLVFADICYFYKMNYLHVHFTDNTTYALPSQLSGISDKDAYTAEQITFFNEYCQNRGITIVPEIDLPGHTTAMIKRRPDLFANDYSKEQPVWEDGTLCAEDSICVGKQGSLENLETLIEELVNMFPNSPYIHIGGDEVNHRVYDACENCKVFIKEHGLKDSEELYAYAVARLAKKVISLGRRPIVWEGFSEKYCNIIPKECIIGVFESLYCTADKLIENGFDVINCSWEPLYSVSWGAQTWWLDDKPWGYREILAWDKFTFKNKYMVSSPVHLNPMHLPKTNKIVGAQMCDWAKYFAQKLPYVREFVPALSERLWSNDRYCTDEQFFLKYCHTTAFFDELTENRDIYKDK